MSSAAAPHEIPCSDLTRVDTQVEGLIKDIDALKAAVADDHDKITALKSSLSTSVKWLSIGLPIILSVIYAVFQLLLARK